jgi:hypothetical protein
MLHQQAVHTYPTSASSGGLPSSFRADSRFSIGDRTRCDIYKLRTYDMLPVDCCAFTAIPTTIAELARTRVTSNKQLRMQVASAQVVEYKAKAGRGTLYHLLHDVCCCEEALLGSWDKPFKHACTIGHWLVDYRAGSHVAVPD